MRRKKEERLRWILEETERRKRRRSGRSGRNETKMREKDTNKVICNLFPDEKQHWRVKYREEK